MVVRAWGGVVRMWVCGVRVRVCVRVRGLHQCVSECFVCAGVLMLSCYAGAGVCTSERASSWT